MCVNPHGQRRPMGHPNPQRVLRQKQTQNQNPILFCVVGEFEGLAGLDEGGAAGSVVEGADGGEGFGVGVAEVEAGEGVESLAGEDGDGVGRGCTNEANRGDRRFGKRLHGEERGGDGWSGRRGLRTRSGEAGWRQGGGFGGASEGVMRGEFNVGVIPGDELESEDREDDSGGEGQPFGVRGRFDFVFQRGERVSVGRRFSVGESFADDGGVNLFFARDEGEGKRAKGNCVYFAGDAAAGLSDEGDGFGSENLCVGSRGL